MEDRQQRQGAQQEAGARGQQVTGAAREQDRADDEVKDEAEADRAADAARKVDGAGQGCPVQADLQVDRTPQASFIRCDPAAAEVEGQVIKEDRERDQDKGQDRQRDRQELGAQAAPGEDAHRRQPAQPDEPVQPLPQFPVERQEPGYPVHLCHVRFTPGFKLRAAIAEPAGRAGLAVVQGAGSVPPSFVRRSDSRIFELIGF